MTRHNPMVRVRHMLDHARETVEMVAGRTRRDLDVDRQLNLALTRLLEIVGEAAGRVPDEDRARCPGIPWEDVVGFRNRIVHGYDSVNFDIVWAIIQNDLPSLICELDRIVSESDNSFM